MKRKYLLLSNGESPHTVRWARSLSVDFDLALVCFGPASEELSRMIDRGRIAEVGSAVRPSGGNIRVLLRLRDVARFVRDFRPDFIHSHYVTSYGLVAALLRRLFRIRADYVCSAWGSDILVAPHRNAAFRWITGFALRAADMITSDSQTMSEAILRLAGPRADVTTFPFGLEVFPEDASFNEKDPSLFYSNRALEPNYRVDEAVQFFHRATSGSPAARLVITNSGGEEGRLKELVARLGLEKQVQFRGFVSIAEKQELYRKAQYFISAPISDATSVSLLEAMAYGCIPILSNIPANREWVAGGENGFFIEEAPTVAEMRSRAETIFRLNRSIIRERAMWDTAYSGFTAKLERTASRNKQGKE